MKSLALKSAVERELKAMLKSSAPPDDARMKLLKLAIQFIAVQAKLEESEYGSFFRIEEGEKSDSSA